MEEWMEEDKVIKENFSQKQQDIPWFHPIRGSYT